MKSLILWLLIFSSAYSAEPYTDAYNYLDKPDKEKPYDYSYEDNYSAEKQYNYSYEYELPDYDIYEYNPEDE